MGKITVEIDTGTKRRLVQCAKRRNQAKPSSSTRRKSGKWTDEELHIMGIIGERAAATVFGEHIDWRVSRNGDGGTDIMVANIVSVSVKFNHRAGGYLMVEKRKQDTPELLKDFSTDIAVLVTGRCMPPDDCECLERMRDDKPWVVDVVGWVSRGTFMERKEYKDFGLGPRWVMKRHGLLLPPDVLFDQLKAGRTDFSNFALCDLARKVA